MHPGKFKSSLLITIQHLHRALCVHSLLISSLVRVEAWWRQYLYQLKWLHLKFIDLFNQVET